VLGLAFFSLLSQDEPMKMDFISRALAFSVLAACTSSPEMVHGHGRSVSADVETSDLDGARRRNFVNLRIGSASESLATPHVTLEVAPWDRV